MKRKGRGTSRIGLHALRGATSQDQPGKGSSQASTSTEQQSRQSTDRQVNTQGPKSTQTPTGSWPPPPPPAKPRSHSQIFLLLLSIPTRSCCPLSLSLFQTTRKMISIPYTLMSCSKTFKKAPVSHPSPQARKTLTTIKPSPRESKPCGFRNVAAPPPTG